jgi:hypothetical protein
VEVGLRPELEFLLLEIAPLTAFAVGKPLRPVDLRHIARASSSRLIDDVDRIAAAGEIFRPAFAAVGRTRIGRAGTRAPMDHHDRKEMGLFLRDPHFDVHLAGYEGLAVDGGRLAADIEKTVTRKVERRIVVSARHPN